MRLALLKVGEWHLYFSACSKILASTLFRVFSLMDSEQLATKLKSGTKKDMVVQCHNYYISNHLPLLRVYMLDQI